MDTIITKRQAGKRRASEPLNCKFVDLGIPSGTLWASRNASHDNEQYFNFESAKPIFGKYMPTADDFQELHDYCIWTLDEERKGYTVTGPNGNSIFLPASGCRDGRGMHEVGSGGYYWSRTACGASTAYLLTFWSDGVFPKNRSHRLCLDSAVRLVRHKTDAGADKPSCLREAVAPLVDWLKDHGDPHTIAIVSQTHVDVYQAAAGDVFEAMD